MEVLLAQAWVVHLFLAGAVKAALQLRALALLAVITVVEEVEGLRSLPPHNPEVQAHRVLLL
jgi:hypothetical protein